MHPSIHGERDVWGATFLIFSCFFFLFPLDSSLHCFLNSPDLQPPQDLYIYSFCLLSNICTLPLSCQMSPSLPLILNSHTSSCPFSDFIP